MAVEHSTEESYRVLVAAGSVPEGDSLAGWLEREGFDVMIATDGGETLQIVGSTWQPDVILLDPTLPGVDGSQADEVRSLEAGADDYVEKRISPEVLLARVRAHLRSRQASGNGRILQPGDLWVDTKNYAARVKGDWVDLRPQEFRLLIALAQSSGVPVSRQELVERAASARRKTSNRTVDMHISRIRARIEPPSDYTYIHSVRGFGYRFEPVPKGASPSSPTPRRLPEGEP